MDLPSPARVPRAVALFGGAGLIPPVALAAGLLLVPAEGARQLIWVALVYYAALIFSFLGGTWWAFTAARPLASRLMIAIAPSLVALALLLSTLDAPLRAWATGVLALAIGLSPLADRALASAELTPAWWLRLRVPLSLGLAICTAVAAFRAPVL